RARRREKSRAAIVAALFDLVGSGVLLPTAQQVAARAGVGIRSVFRHFDDMESLYAELDARLREEALPLLREAPPSGPLRERAGALVEQRVRLFERIAPYKRAGNLQRWRSDFLKRQHAALVRELRGALREALPELEEAPAAIGEALDLVTSFEAWDRLRTDQRLSRERAQDAVERAVLGLVESLRNTRTRR
ncbi:MAG: TetR family transcriptional regulator, partial [Myxococcota bacterium]